MITACRPSQLLHAIQHGRVHWHCCCKTISPRRASAPCQREVSLGRLLEVAQLEVVVRMLSDRIQELVIAGFSNSKVPVVQWISESKAQAPLLLAQPFLHTSVMTLMIA